MRISTAYTALLFHSFSHVLGICYDIEFSGVGHVCMERAGMHMQFAMPAGS